MVRLFMLRECKTIMVRRCHMDDVLTWCMYYFWLPTPAEVECRHLMATEAYVETNRILSMPGRHRRYPWLPGWIGGYTRGFELGAEGGA